MDEGGGNGARFRKIPVPPVSRYIAHMATSMGLRTTAEDSQSDGPLFSCGGFALDVLGAAYFGYLEKTGDMAQVGPYLVANGGIVVGQHVETLGCEHVDGF